MLVLSRAKHEKVIIGDIIEVVVVEIVGHKVRLGFKAPSEISIHREEVWNEIQRQKAAAAASTGDEIPGG